MDIRWIRECRAAAPSALHKPRRCRGRLASAGFVDTPSTEYPRGSRGGAATRRRSLPRRAQVLSTLKAAGAVGGNENAAPRATVSCALPQLDRFSSLKRYEICLRTARCCFCLCVGRLRPAICESSLCQSVDRSRTIRVASHGAATRPRLVRDASTAIIIHACHGTDSAQNHARPAEYPRGTRGVAATRPRLVHV